MIKEKSHRLPKDLYRGKVSAAFTICIRDGVPAFTERAIIGIFTNLLNSAVEKALCIVPVYCFMPDHLHLIITGTSDESDVISAVVRYKQRTGYWLSLNKPELRWQKDFYDHIIRTNENLSVQARYILDNPVRKGLVESWRDYPYKGSIGCELEAVLNCIM